MKIEKQHLKEFFHFSFLDVVFCLAVAILFLPYDKEEYGLVTIICGWFAMIYIIASMLNLSGSLFRIFAKRPTDILALIFSLNILFLICTFFGASFMFGSFDFKRFFYFTEPRTLLFYASGAIAIASLVYRDRYKKRLEEKNL